MIRLPECNRIPTNPLLQAGDLEKVKELCIKQDALLVIDPTMVSPKNAKILPGDGGERLQNMRVGKVM